ncbi:UPF0187 protein [Seminavis robusta]|uniref:UPF0187 protein n=1 Tax=Seminavis robusta TaxID=568900 RepID=A0A9N8D717_9STRA|nr:UPF0187 protein [Seminavis robusta]|eukprot:Sro4_g003850.1 UPF0187 protein (578) ;mRNA; r:260457-262333
MSLSLSDSSRQKKKDTSIAMRHWRFKTALITPAAAVVLMLGQSGNAFLPLQTNTFRTNSQRIRKPIIVSGISTTTDANGDNNNNNGADLIYNPSLDDEHVYVTPTTALYTGDPNDHRYSASDWLANVKSLPRSTILRAIQGPVISVMVWSCVVSGVHRLLKLLHLKAVDAMCISSKPHSFLVSALGLLLVFRTNSAYQRFAEGRKIWEQILSISRNISRLACLYEDDLGHERKHRIFRLLGAFPYLLHHHIQPQCLTPKDYNQLKGTKYALKLQDCADLCYEQDKNNSDNGNILAYMAQTMRRVRGGKNKQQQQQQDEDVYCGLVDRDECETCLVDRRALPWCLLPPAALTKCVDSDNRPLWICDRLAQELTNVGYSDNFTSRERLAFLSQIDKLSKSIGECERISQTAVPLNYARHSLRSLTIWLFSLPFALVNEFGMLTAPVMGVISWTLFGVYQIGSTIEDPFQGSLRLSILCDAIYRDVMYDADLRNRRDSAFHLEPELIEWDQMGPIDGQGEADSNPFLSLPPNGENASAMPQQSTAPSLSKTEVEERKTTDKESRKQPPPSQDSDPMQPRP